MSNISKSAQKAYKKARNAKKKTIKQAEKKHWLFIKKGDSGKEIASKLFTQLAVVVLVGCIVILGHEFWLSFSAKKLNSSLQDLYYKYIAGDTSGGIFTDRGGKLLSSAEALLEVNPDTVGWVSIDGTHINLPVVQRRDITGNDYYLKRAFDGSNNKAGTLFLDMRNTLTYGERSDNLIIYGHNQKDKTMFGDLAEYKKNIDFYKEHPIVKFSSNFRADDYKIFAYFVTPVLPSQTADGHVFDYHNFIDLSDKDTFNTFMNEVTLRNEIITPVDVLYGDEILTLSTCSNEFEPSRFVVFARKVRENEDSTVLTELASINPEAKEPDYDVIYG
jgi:sortase B